MSSRTSRITASVLIAGCLCLPLATPAATASSASLWRAAAASSGVLGSFWSLLTNLWAGDDDHGATDHGHGPHTDEGPGMCPHGGH